MLYFYSRANIFQGHNFLIKQNTIWYTKAKFATIFTAQGLKCSFLELRDPSSMCKHHANDDEIIKCLVNIVTEG